MTDTVLIAIIAAIPGSIAALAAVRATRKVGETQSLVQKIELSINSRMTALLETTEAAARLAGIAAERLESAERAATVSRDTAIITANVAEIAEAKAEARNPGEPT